MDSNQFPCGPCPALDQFKTAIRHYEVVRRNLVTCLKENPTNTNYLVTTAQVSLLDGFISHLWCFVEAVCDSIYNHETERNE